MHKVKKIANDKSPKIVIRSTHFLSPKSETLVPKLRHQGFFYNLTGQETKKNNDRKHYCPKLQRSKLESDAKDAGRSQK